MHEQKIGTRYLMEMLGTLALYAVVLVISLELGLPMPKGTFRTLVLLSPLLPTLLMVWVIVRQISRVDEYVRLQALENLSIAAAVTAVWTFAYGFLENAGFPRLSMFTVWGVMGVVWFLLAMVRLVADR